MHTQPIWLKYIIDYMRERITTKTASPRYESLLDVLDTSHIPPQLGRAYLHLFLQRMLESSQLMANVEYADAAYLTKQLANYHVTCARQALLDVMAPSNNRLKFSGLNKLEGLMLDRKAHRRVMPTNYLQAALLVLHHVAEKPEHPDNLRGMLASLVHGGIPFRRTGVECFEEVLSILHQVLRPQVALDCVEAGFAFIKTPAEGQKLDDLSRFLPSLFEEKPTGEHLSVAA